MKFMVYLDKDGNLKALGPTMYLKSVSFVPQGVVGFTKEDFAKLPINEEVVMSVKESDLSDLGKTHFASVLDKGTALILAKKVNPN